MTIPTSSMPLIVPCPQDLSWQDGEFQMPQSVVLTVPAMVGRECVAWMLELWRQFTRDRVLLEVVTTTDRAWQWRLSSQASATSAALRTDDAYALVVTASAVAGAAQDEGSLRHSWSTLMQLISLRGSSQGSGAVVLPQVEIHDRPALAMRMLHLCVFPETRREVLEKTIVLAGMMKYTHVIVEFWGTFRFACLKELSWPEAWSPEEARQLFALIRHHGMEAIPSFNLWGHATQSRIGGGRHVVLDQDPGLAHLFEPDGWTWCLSDPQARSLLGQVIDELCACAGPGRYFHIGCDEAHSHATCDRCRNTDRTALLATHLNATAATLRAAGRRTIMWGDALLDRAAWPAQIAATSTAWNPTCQVVAQLDRSIIIADWQYGVVDGEMATVRHFRDLGFEVLVCPWDDRRNIEVAATTAKAQGALGVLATTWHVLQEKLLLLPIAAQVSWSSDPQIFAGRAGDYAVLLSHMATLVRTMAPAHGRYAVAGWKDQEV